MEEVERLRVREKKLQEAIEIWKKKSKQQKKTIKAMAEWIYNNDVYTKICVESRKKSCCVDCQQCIINYFEEVKE